METTLDATTALASSPVNIWPVGMITPFSENLEVMTKEEIKKLQDEGWFFCDGAALAEKDYPRLFKVLGHTCGGTSPSFCIPDLRGVFLRGVDGEGAISRDPDAATRKSHTADTPAPNQVLSRQDTEIKSHGHITPKGSQFKEQVNAQQPQGGPRHGFQRFDRPKDGEKISANVVGAVESRGVNVSVNYIIFAGPAITTAIPQNL